MEPRSTAAVDALRTLGRVLTFRATTEELQALSRPHLAVGLLFTWLVGIGRWWDDPGAPLVLHLGLGSVFYVFALSLLLWLVFRPLQPRGWSYKRLLTFISLTAPPGLLYAIPVEMWMDVGGATRANLGFLAVYLVNNPGDQAAAQEAPSGFSAARAAITSANGGISPPCVSRSRR